MKTALSIALVILFAGCMASYTSPRTYEVERERTYAKPFDEVWDKIIEWFALKHLQVKEADKSSGSVLAEIRLNVKHSSECCDCGNATEGVFEQKTISLARVNVSILARESDETHTLVKVSMFFWTTLDSSGEYGHGARKIECSSKGLWESDLLEHISPTIHQDLPGQVVF